MPAQRSFATVLPRILRMAALWFACFAATSRGQGFSDCDVCGTVGDLTPLRFFNLDSSCLQLGTRNLCEFLETLDGLPCSNLAESDLFFPQECALLPAIVSDSCCEGPRNPFPTIAPIDEVEENPGFFTLLGVFLGTILGNAVGSDDESRDPIFGGGDDESRDPIFGGGDDESRDPIFGDGSRDPIFGENERDPAADESLFLNLGRLFRIIFDSLF